MRDEMKQKFENEIVALLKEKIEDSRKSPEKTLSGRISTALIGK
jgi:hypothetical protein